MLISKFTPSADFEKTISSVLILSRHHYKGDATIYKLPNSNDLILLKGTYVTNNKITLLDSLNINGQVISEYNEVENKGSSLTIKGEGFFIEHKIMSSVLLNSMCSDFSDEGFSLVANLLKMHYKYKSFSIVEIEDISSINVRNNTAILFLTNGSVISPKNIEYKPKKGDVLKINGDGLITFSKKISLIKIEFK